MRRVAQRLAGVGRSRPVRYASSGVLLACGTLLGCGDDTPGFDFDESAPIQCAVGQQVVAPTEPALYHGVYPGGRTGEEDDVAPSDLQEYEAAVGHSAAWVYFSNNWYQVKF